MQKTLYSKAITSIIHLLRAGEVRPQKVKIPLYSVLAPTPKPRKPCRLLSKSSLRRIPQTI